MRRAPSQILALAMAVCCSSCSKDEVTTGLPDGGTPGAGLQEGEPAPDFKLEDWNATSPTFGQQVSPRDQLGKISAWFFGWST